MVTTELVPAGAVDRVLASVVTPGVLVASLVIDGVLPALGEAEGEVAPP